MGLYKLKFWVGYNNKNSIQKVWIRLREKLIFSGLKNSLRVIIRSGKDDDLLCRWKDPFGGMNKYRNLNFIMKFVKIYNYCINIEGALG